MNISQLDTPALIVDLEKLERNLAEMQKRVESQGMTLRPHTKAHKIPAIAQMQLDAGAVGICTSKLGEAEVMVLGGIKDVLITTPIAGEIKIERLVRLCSENPESTVRQVIDHPSHVTEIGRQAASNGVEIGLLVEVESGQQRCGVEPDAALLDLIELIKVTEGVRYDGIQAYSGHLQLVKGFEPRQAAARDAVAKVFDYIKMELAPRGLEPTIISGGGTGTYQAHIDQPFTEIQAGSYLFMDATYSAIGDESSDEVNGQFETALSVLSTVISHPAADRAVIDAGMKSLSIDLGMPRVKYQDKVTYKTGGDEHGILLMELNESPYKIGDRVMLLPSHCDTTLHNFDVLHAVRKDKVVGQWRIEGRGRSD
ncbi:DSD1 family PLP-dependent enzyme [Vibrio astriarenae]|uniref:DSD1 family PLP-dependent enzyme n=1 Tax=Vibrio astriarenae TaxID=1481923 RepID=A0A7Z2T5V2_9VIBR|nr:DSD1 family PLP-dependent enzyme [Vibrio astriarenae]QIA64974.1 DSD1 family PLP-dependent enzyme [Vibrio astriarenae]